MSVISILLVEDNDDDRFLATRLIRKLPYELKIEIAKNGEDLIKRILDDKTGAHDLPSLILLDLQLPKISGIKVLTKIRKKFSGSELPVIILTSSDDPGDIARCSELEIIGYLSKPLNFTALLEHLQTIIPP